MATTTKIAPYTGLCKFCLNLTKTQKYFPESDEEESALHLACSAIPNLVFSDVKAEQSTFGVVAFDAVNNLTTLETNVSNCNKYLSGARVLINLVTYDPAVPHMVVNYTIENISLVAAPVQIDFYLVGNSTSLGLVSPAANGTLNINLLGARANGNYYLYAQLSTGEISLIYPFAIS